MLRAGGPSDTVIIIMKKVWRSGGRLRWLDSVTQERRLAKMTIQQCKGVIMSSVSEPQTPRHNLFSVWKHKQDREFSPA